MHARQIGASFVLYLFGIYLGAECRSRSPSVAMLSANMAAEAAHEEGGCMMLVVSNT